MRDDSNHISLITKIRAMEGKMLTDIDYNNMHSMNSIVEVFSYLREKEQYREIFNNQDEMVNLRRSHLEHLLVHGLYESIFKIYKFASGDERKFLDIIITRFEIDLIKRGIASLEDIHVERRKVEYSSFFKKHSGVDFEELLKSENINQIAMSLKNSKYHKVFSDMLARNYSKLSDYERDLDIYYFTNIWSSKDKFNDDIKNIITSIIGSEIDFYNMKTIYRCKKFYNINHESMKKYIVPIVHKITKIQLDDMIQSKDCNELVSIIKTTRYKDVGLVFDIKNTEASFERAINNIHMKFIKKNPNSLARVYSYFEKKMYEVHYTTRIIENIRYR